MSLAANQDFADLLMCFDDAGVEYLVVGAYALAAHGHVRATGDIDVFVRPTDSNAQCVYNALIEFGAPVAQHGVVAADFAAPGTVYQLGLPPRRIDILTQLSGVSFDEAASESIVGNLANRSVRFPGLLALIKNKRAAGRAKDLADAQVLEAIAAGRPAAE